MIILYDNKLISRGYKKPDKVKFLLKNCKNFKAIVGYDSFDLDEPKWVEWLKKENEKIDLLKKEKKKQKPKEKFYKPINLATIVYQDVYPDGHPDHDSDPCHNCGIEKIRSRRDRRRDPEIEIMPITPKNNKPDFVLVANADPFNIVPEMILDSDNSDIEEELEIINSSIKIKYIYIIKKQVKNLIWRN